MNFLYVCNTSIKKFVKRNKHKDTEFMKYPHIFKGEKDNYINK